VADPASCYEAFAAALPDDAAAVAAQHRTAIEGALADALRRCEAAWPGVTVSAEMFASAMATNIVADPLVELAELHVTDLYIAHACAAGLPAAVAAFEQSYGATIAETLQALGLDQAGVADVAQDVRAHLLVAAQSFTPKIATYTGRGTLRNWVRAVAARRAASASRRPADRPLVDDMIENDVLDDVPGIGDGPERAHFRATYRAEVKQAFEAALATLTPQQRNLLRHRYVDELTVEAIGALYGVHKASASRWLDEARAVLAKRTRNAFIQRTHVTPSQLRSVIGLLDSHVELSLPRVLAGEGR
jgi:RNA polymerase sigma-70 factor (ECF subfamily)